VYTIKILLGKILNIFYPRKHNSLSSDYEMISYIHLQVAQNLGNIYTANFL